MKLNLTLAERFTLLGILPKASNFLTMEKIKDFQDALVPSDDEVVKHKIVPNQRGGVQWAKEASNYEAEFVIGDIVEAEVEKVLKTKDEQRDLKLDEVTLFEKFLKKD